MQQSRSRALIAKLEKVSRMPDQETVTFTGRVTDIFAHRFVLETSAGKRILADLGPKGADMFPLTHGRQVDLVGEMKASEVKVSGIAQTGQDLVAIGHKKNEHGHGDPEAAARATKAAGFEMVGDPRRKPEHFEVLGRRDGAYFECHVAFDGTIRKEKPVEATDGKWSSDIKTAA